jgi:hypothetical protein
MVIVIKIDRHGLRNINTINTLRFNESQLIKEIIKEIEDRRAFRRAFVWKLETGSESNVQVNNINELSMSTLQALPPIPYLRRYSITAPALINGYKYLAIHSQRLSFVI